MTPERWKRLEEIYHSARERDSASRAAYLAAACGQDEDLRLQIESLLADGEMLSKLESAAQSGISPSALKEGVMIGPYRIEERLDAGGMGVVYRAEDTRLNRQVAIKVGSAEFSDRFHREARTVAALNHPNVCTLHDIGSTPDVPGYLVMEFVEGPTLATRLERRQMPVVEALQIAHQIAAALAAAHERGIVHRDLKPANVKITPQGTVKVLDFGLAKNFPGMHRESDLPETGTQQMTLTAAGTILGTAAYMSPEQAAGKDADARSDIFSFGIVLYEMLCGRRPFTGSSTTEVMAAILKTECAPPRQLRPDIPEPVERIVLKCLQRDPKSRYASGTELEQDLAAVVSGSETGRFLSLRAALAVAALLIAVVGGYYGWQSYRREADLRWLEETAVPEIEKLLTQNRAFEAHRLYREAERIAPDSKLLYRLAEGVASHPVSFETTPAGATIYVSDYTAAADDDLSNWQRLGEAPVTTSMPDWGYYRVRAVKEGYAPADQVFAEAGAVTLTLHPSGTVPEGMVWVPPTSSTQVQPSIALPGFWIDRYEVTNRQFQSFVKAGGYEKPEYWRETFVKDGRPLSWKQAMLEFHDLTGRPGPASWILGTSRDGEADLPAAGVSWYEAVAYCEYAGKAIPTFYEWRRAAPVEFNADVVLMSNFSGKGPSPAGTHRGMTAFGSYDMAGNVKEWTVNTDGTRRYALGGAWNEASYVFSIADALDSFSRTIDLGFRCVKRPTPAPAESLAPLQLRPREVRSEKPVDDATYRVFAGYHQYEPSELDPGEEHVDSLSPYYTRERITFRAAYDDRVLAHLFLPKNTMPPHHVVIVFGGSGIMSAKRVEDFGFPYEFLILSGRAVMIPAYAGTLERGPSDLRLPPQEERDRSLKWSWDLSRSVDYLQARAKAHGDVDATKLGFYGISWGASHAARLLAVEKRFRAAVWLSGGLLTEQPREVDSWNFARHYTVPTLMINGKQDFTIPLKTNVEMLFNALGTPIAHKKLYLTEGGHRNPVTQPEVLGETIKWFDRYLGPVEER